MGYSPQGCQELDMTEQLALSLFCEKPCPIVRVWRDEIKNRQKIILPSNVKAFILKNDYGNLS